MRDLVALTGERLARAEEWLRDPPAGSRAATAREYGIDLTLLIGQLRLSPEARLRKLEGMANDLEKLRGIARRPRR